MAATDEYLENQVLTASPHQLHLMVLDGAIRFARQGMAAMSDGSGESVRWALQRARNCVSDLIGAIKPQTAPELAEPQKQLFLNVYWNLAVAEIERNPERIEVGLRILQMHRETWVELGRKLQVSGPSAAAKRSSILEPHLATGRSWMT